MVELVARKNFRAVVLTCMMLLPRGNSTPNWLLYQKKGHLSGNLTKSTKVPDRNLSLLPQQIHVPARRPPVPPGCVALNETYNRGEKVLRWPKGVGRGVRLMSLRLDQRGADACPAVLLRLRLRLLFLLYRRGRHPLPLKVESRAVWLEQSLEKLDLARTRTLSGAMWRAVESGLNSEGKRYLEREVAKVSRKLLSLSQKKLES